MMEQLHREGRNEFQLFTVFMCLLTGYAQVFLAEVPDDLRGLSPIYQTAWSWSLLIGSAAVLLGLVFRDAFWGLLIEATGLTLLGGVTLAYGAAVILSDRIALASLLAVPIILAFSLACWHRTYRIFKKLVLRRGRQQLIREEVQKQLTEQSLDDIVAQKRREQGDPPWN